MNDEQLVAEIVRQVRETPMSDVMEELNLLTPQEAADRLKIARSTFYNKINRGEMPAIKMDRVVRISPRDLLAYLRLKTCNPVKEAAAA